MLKIGPRIERKINRYLYKNTVRAKYNRNMDLGVWTGVAAGVELFRLPHWQPADFGITSMLYAVSLRSIGKGLKHLFELQPIRKRAIKIKKAAKSKM